MKYLKLYESFKDLISSSKEMSKEIDEFSWKTYYYEQENRKELIKYVIELFKIIQGEKNNNIYWESRDLEGSGIKYNGLNIYNIIFRYNKFSDTKTRNETKITFEQYNNDFQIKYHPTFTLNTIPLEPLLGLFQFLLKRPEIVKHYTPKTLKKMNSYSPKKMNESVTDKLDNILDKIGKNGFSSLTDEERTYLNSFKNNKQEEVYKEQSKKVYQENNFKFELDRVEHNGDNINLYGKITISNRISLDGKIQYLETGLTDPQFEDDDGLTIWDYVSPDDAYDLDNFINNIVEDNI